MVSIVTENDRHWPHVAALNREAFGGDFEARLIERLRAAGLVVSSLVSVSGGEVVGHILFSDLTVAVDGRSVAAVSLAPMAVRPACQRQGIGSRLVRAGLDEVRQKGRAAVIVVGHAAYYPRFGFSAELARRLSSVYAGPAFMALELVPGALTGGSGTVRYPDAFSAS